MPPIRNIQELSYYRRRKGDGSQKESPHGEAPQGGQTQAGTIPGPPSTTTNAARPMTNEEYALVYGDQWTDDMEISFIKLLRDFVFKGSCGEGNIGQDSFGVRWENLAVQLARDCSVEFTNADINDKFIRTQSNWRGWRQLHRDPDFQFDPGTGLFLASEESWGRLHDDVDRQPTQFRYVPMKFALEYDCIFSIFNGRPMLAMTMAHPEVQALVMDSDSS